MLSEESQTEKDKYHIVSLIRGIAVCLEVRKRLPDYLLFLKIVLAIPSVVQCMLIACLTPKSLYLPGPHSYVVPIPPHW